MAGPLQQHLQLQGAEQPSSPGRSQSSRSSSGSQGAPQGEPALGPVNDHILDPPVASQEPRWGTVEACSVLTSDLSPAGAARMHSRVCLCWAIMNLQVCHEARLCWGMCDLLHAARHP